MEIKVPQTINDAPLERLAAWAKYTAEMGDLEKFSQKIEFRVEVVSIFSGVSKYELNKVSYRDLNEAFIHCMSIILDYEQKEPTGVIETDGKRYVWDKDIHNVSTGQVIDIKLIDDVYKNPYQIMSTLYIEEGLTYNEESKGKVINPPDEREKVFRDAPIGEEFLNLLSFFLSDYILLKAATLGKTPRATKKILRKAAKRAMMSGTSGQAT